MITRTEHRPAGNRVAKQHPGNANANRRQRAVPAKAQALRRIVSGAVLLLALSLGGALGACSSEPPPIIITMVSVASQHYVHIETVSFNNGQWGAPAGVCYDGYGPPPAGSSGAIMGPHPVPTRVFVRWFDYPKQRFYEADLDLPDLPAKALEAVGKRDPRFPYRNSLIVAVGAQGEVRLWLRGAADGDAAWQEIDKLPNWYEVQFPVHLIGSGQARYASGDPIEYRDRTAAARAKGEIPQETVPSDDDKQQQTDP